ncbi:hypothetical protein FQ192_04995 [Pseudomonas sp. ANT_J12]|nr:hypothetical protein FQ192_04995 [Pseudomonas sp. ANT_J12]
MARGLAPVGSRSGPLLFSKRRGLLRSPTEASPLATKARPIKGCVGIRRLRLDPPDGRCLFGYVLGGNASGCCDGRR